MSLGNAVLSLRAGSGRAIGTPVALFLALRQPVIGRHDRPIRYDHQPRRLHNQPALSGRGLLRLWQLEAVTLHSFFSSGEFLPLSGKFGKRCDGLTVPRLVETLLGSVAHAAFPAILERSWRSFGVTILSVLKEGGQESHSGRSRT
jgi:hypothetical protein